VFLSLELDIKVRTETPVPVTPSGGPWSGLGFLDLLCWRLTTALPLHGLHAFYFAPRIVLGTWETRMDETLPLIQWGFLMEADQEKKVHWGITETLLEDGKNHRTSRPRTAERELRESCRAGPGAPSLGPFGSTAPFSSLLLLWDDFPQADLKPQKGRDQIHHFH